MPSVSALRLRFLFWLKFCLHITCSICLYWIDFFCFTTRPLRVWSFLLDIVSVETGDLQIWEISDILGIIVEWGVTLLENIWWKVCVKSKNSARFLEAVVAAAYRADFSLNFLWSFTKFFKNKCWFPGFTKFDSACLFSLSGGNSLDFLS